MAGYNAVLALRRLEQDLDMLGLMLCNPKHGNWSGSEDFGDRAGVKPKDENALPIYTRDAELFVGTLNEIRIWVQGVSWARNYDGMLKLSDEKKRTKKEDEYRHREMLRALAKDHSNAQEKAK